jgi:HEAT repeat protein
VTPATVFGTGGLLTIAVTLLLAGGGMVAAPLLLRQAPAAAQQPEPSLTLAHAAQPGGVPADRAAGRPTVRPPAQPRDNDPNDPEQNKREAERKRREAERALEQTNRGPLQQKISQLEQTIRRLEQKISGVNSDSSRNDGAVRAQPSAALGLLGAETLTLQVLLDRLQTDSNPDVRAAAEKVLRENLTILTGADVPRLRGGLKNGNLKVRGYCAEALEKLGRDGQEAAPDLARALDDTDKEVRDHAVAALLGIGPGATAAVPTLIQVLEEGNKDASHLAAVVLKALGPAARAAVPDLVPLLRDAKLCKEAVEVLGEIGQDAVPALKQALAREDLRRAALQALEYMGPAAEGAIPELLDCLEDEDVGVWEEALGTLKAIGKAGVPKLLQALQSDREEVRRGSARTLGNVANNTKEVMRALQALKNEHRGKDTPAAGEALRKIQDRCGGFLLR